MALTQVDQGLLGQYAQYTGFKNRIINGAMTIDQRNAGASLTGNGSSAQYCLDRWNCANSVASKITVQQSSTAPVGFKNSLLVTSSSAYTLLAGDYFLVRQQVEGYNVADLAWGTANAATITISFWVRSSLTGTFGGALANGAFNRSYPFTYTINSANTWEQKTLTIAGDQSGTWATDNGIGIYVSFGFGVGSTYSGPSTGSWAASGYVTATGATSVVGTSGATWYITGVQLEKGSTATSFDYRPYGTELALCQRYFEMSFQQGTAPANGASSSALLTEVGAVRIYASGSTGNDGSYVPYKVTKRTNPTITAYGNSSGQWLLTGNTNAGITIVGASADAFSAYQTATGSIVGFRGHYTSSAEL